MEELQDLWTEFHVRLEEENRSLSTTWTNITFQKKKKRNSQEEDVIIMGGMELWQSCQIYGGELMPMIERMWDVIPMFATNDRVYSSMNVSNSHIDEQQQQQHQEQQMLIDMVKNCHNKLVQQVKYVLNDLLFQNDWDDGTAQGQGTVAQWFQLFFSLSSDNGNSKSNSDDEENDSIEIIVKEYESYQRRILRQRCKPCIAHVAQIRKLVKNNQNNTSDMTVGEWLLAQNELYNSQHDDAEEEEEEARRYRQQPHAHAVMVILAEASNLILPLSQWFDGLNSSKRDEIISNMCRNTIQTLHQEVLNLATTVGDWFMQDYHIRTSQQQQQDEVEGIDINLALMDATLEEMSFLCQVVSRYGIFIDSLGPDLMMNSEEEAEQKKKCELMQNFYPELSLHYSIKETNFNQHNWQRAQSMAYATQLIQDEPMYLSSIIEDAVYLCQRALERANSTMSERAMWTVSNWVVELWSPSLHTNSLDREKTQTTNDFYDNVYTALVNQVGCVVNHDDCNQNHNNNTRQDCNNKNNESCVKSAPSSGNSLIFGGKFANALIQALDQDNLDGASNNSKSSQKKVYKSPGNARWRAMQTKLDSDFCTMNAIHATGTACCSLAELLDSLVSEDNDLDENNEETTPPEQTSSTLRGEENVKPQQQLQRSNSVSMVQLAKEQLLSHSKEYQKILKEYIHSDVIPRWCGSVPENDLTFRPPAAVLATMDMAPPLLHLYYYLTARQDYNIVDASTFHHREEQQEDTRIFDAIFLSPKCRLIDQRNKCQNDVKLVLLSELAHHIAHMILYSILAQKKQFTDWGSLILSKQVRTLENMFCNTFVVTNSTNYNASSTLSAANEISDGISGDGDMVNTSLIWNQFQKLAEAVTILQLERPSDWLAFAPSTNGEQLLTATERRDIMRLRVDFSDEAILAVCSNTTR